MRLDALLRPRSIAILGASERPSIGRALMESLATHRLRGRRSTRSIRSTRRSSASAAIPRIGSCPGAGRGGVLRQPHARRSSTARPPPSRGAGGAVIFDGGFAEHGEEGRRAAGRARRRCAARRGSRCAAPTAWACSIRTHRAPSTSRRCAIPARLAGNVGLISQSGSICIGMLAECRRFGCSHVISSGQRGGGQRRAVPRGRSSTIRDTKVIAHVHRERSPSPSATSPRSTGPPTRASPSWSSRSAASERTRRAISSHTGGLAGESAVFSAMLRAHRAIEVERPGRADGSARGLPGPSAGPRAAGSP